jgi:hypothetical protein
MSPRTALTSSWVPLLPGTWGLPGPAVLVEEADLGVGDTDLPATGFTAVVPGFTEVEISQASNLRVEHDASDPHTLVVFKAAATEYRPLDTWGIFNAAGPTRPGGPGWQAAGTLRTPSTDPATYLAEFGQALTAHGAVLLLTGSPTAYWTLADTLQHPGLDDVSTGSDWVAWLPLGSRASDRIESPAPPPGLGRRLLRRLVS